MFCCSFLLGQTLTYISFCNIQAFSKKKVEERKEWLTNFMEDRRQRKLHGLPEVEGLHI